MLNPRSLQAPLGPTLWVVLLVTSIVAGIPSGVRLVLSDGLVSLRPGAVVLAGLCLYLLLTWRTYRWGASDRALIWLGFLAAVIVARSIWPLITDEPETYFVSLPDFTGSPSWVGSVHAKGLVTASLLSTYVLLCAVSARLAAHRQIGPLLVSKAANALVASTTIFALIFLGAFAFSILRSGWDPTSWVVVIRGIDVGHLRASLPWMAVGPDEGVLFATCAACAGVRLLNANRKRWLAIAAIILSAAAILSFSRTAWLAWLFGGLLFLWWRERTLERPKRTLLPLAFLSLMLCIAVVSIATIPNTDGPLARFTDLTGGTAGFRLQQYATLIGALASSPIVGFGAEGYRPFTNGFPAENFWVEIAFSGGLLAITALTAAHVRLISSFRRWRHTAISMQAGWLPGLYCALWVQGFGMLFSTAGWLPTYWLLFGLTLGLLRPQQMVGELSIEHSSRLPLAREAPHKVRSLG